jgi:hypothetical protein
MREKIKASATKFLLPAPLDEQNKFHFYYYFTIFTFMFALTTTGSIRARTTKRERESEVFRYFLPCHSFSILHFVVPQYISLARAYYSNVKYFSCQQRQRSAKSRSYFVHILYICHMLKRVSIISFHFLCISIFFLFYFPHSWHNPSMMMMMVMALGRCL